MLSVPAFIPGFKWYAFGPDMPGCAWHAFRFWGGIHSGDTVLGFCYGGYARVVWSPSGWFVVTFWEGSIRVTLPGRGALLGDFHTDIRPVGPLGVLFLLGVI